MIELSLRNKQKFRGYLEDKKNKKKNDDETRKKMMPLQNEQMRLVISFILAAFRFWLEALNIDIERYEETIRHVIE